MISNHCHRSHKPRYWRQSVRLTGLSCPFFSEYEGKIQYIETLLARQVSSQSLEKWQGGHINGHSNIGASNLFFTDHRFQQSKPSVPFAASVDPRGILTTAMGDSLVHLEDNEVLYFQASQNTSTNKTK